MLFLLNRPDPAALDLVAMLAGDADKELLLISDGVYLSSKAAWNHLETLDFDEIYAESQAVSLRHVQPEAGCQVVDMEEIVDIMLDNAKVLNI